jgi:hypothetical protein
MTRPSKVALTPARLATDGSQGEDAKAANQCREQHRPQDVAALFLARVALDAARAQLDLYALTTDDPLPGLVDAADHLDAGATALSQLTIFAPLKKGRGPEGVA